MKVIITGATGFVGGAVIQECISNPAITSAVVLSRRPLDNAVEGNPKIKVIIHKDFTEYPSELLDELKGATCCLWAIGGRANQFSSLEEFHRSQHDTTLTAAKVFTAHLATADTKFRFVFCSGKFTEWDQDAKLWFLSDSRKSKGFVEKELFDIAEQNKDRLEVYCVRPGGIIPAGSGALHVARAKIVFGIAVDTLASAMCKIAVEGYGKHIIENDELITIAEAKKA